MQKSHLNQREHETRKGLFNRLMYRQVSLWYIEAESQTYSVMYEPKPNLNLLKVKIFPRVDILVSFMHLMTS